MWVIQHLEVLRPTIHQSHQQATTNPLHLLLGIRSQVVLQATHRLVVPQGTPRVECQAMPHRVRLPHLREDTGVTVSQVLHLQPLGVKLPLPQGEWRMPLMWPQEVM